MRNVLALSVLLCVAGTATADQAEAPGQALRPELWASSDADGTETRKLGLGWDFQRRDIEHWIGAKVETARFSGSGWSGTEQRVYFRAAGGQGDWRWRVEPGSNGHDLLGSASVHSVDERRKEFFVEREVLETRAGIEQGLVNTFAGAAIDLPLNPRWTATALAGAQDFSGGDNLRTHLRGNLIYGVLPEQGISLQLRSRYFHNSEPFEGDYYSPQWYGEVLGVVALRRNVSGYQWRAAAGYGRQRSDVEGWKRARMLEVGVDTPRWKRVWLRANAGYKDTPVLSVAGSTRYAYRYLGVEAVIDF